MHSSLGGGIHSPGFRGGGRRSPVGGPSPTEMLTAAASASSVMTSLSKIPGPQPVPAPVTVGTRGAPPPFRHPPDHPAVTPPPPTHIGKTVFLKTLEPGARYVHRPEKYRTSDTVNVWHVILQSIYLLAFLK